MMYNGAGNVNSSGESPRNPFPLLYQPSMMNSVPLSHFSDDDFPRRDERFPQWGNQETKDLIQIRAQLEWDFSTAKRTKNLWEVVANRMRDKGYRRTGDQCKCKWKNLLNRYKGQEASDVNAGRQCPFFDELHAVFTERAKAVQQGQHDNEAGNVKGKRRLKSVSGDQSLEGTEDDEETEVDQAGRERSVPKRKLDKEKRKLGEPENYSLTDGKKNDSVLNGLQEMMRSFFVQQQRIDVQWRELIEKRTKEREGFEEEWRKKMEQLERERLTMEQAWREREEQHRVRDESRAEKRDALLTTLLNKLIRDESG